MLPHIRRFLLSALHVPGNPEGRRTITHLRKFSCFAIGFTGVMMFLMVLGYCYDQFLFDHSRRITATVLDVQPSSRPDRTDVTLRYIEPSGDPRTVVKAFEPRGMKRIVVGGQVELLFNPDRRPEALIIASWEEAYIYTFAGVVATLAGVVLLLIAGAAWLWVWAFPPKVWV